MKNVLFLFIFFFIGQQLVVAQEFETETQLVEAVIGQQRKNLIVANVDIPEDKNDTFWNIYNDYESHRKSLAREQVNLVNTYLSMIGQSPKKEDMRFMDKVFHYRRNSEKLIEKYVDQFERKVSSKTAMQFFQVEMYIQNKVDTKMFENLPMNRVDETNN